jgi:hypothetical protein
MAESELALVVARMSARMDAAMRPSKPPGVGAATAGYSMVLTIATAAGRARHCGTSTALTAIASRVAEPLGDVTVTVILPGCAPTGYGEKVY